MPHHPECRNFPVHIIHGSWIFSKKQTCKVFDEIDKMKLYLNSCYKLQVWEVLVLFLVSFITINQEVRHNDR